MHDESKVRKVYHCAWQIHYHIVFPFKYRKSLLDEEVVQIIRETVTGIEERYEIEMETMVWIERTGPAKLDSDISDKTALQ